MAEHNGNGNGRAPEPEAGAEAPRKRKRRGESGGLTPRERMEKGYARAEERNQAVREGLTPLAEGERPLVVTIGAALAALVALSIVGGYLAGVKVDGERPEIPQVVAPALLMGVMAWGMWRARYWAVLGFQLLLIFLIFSAVFGLAVQATSIGEIVTTLGLLAVSGTFFYFMVKAMARIQMPTRR